MQHTADTLAATARQCYTEQLFAGTSGNLSVYIPEKDTLLITPTSLAWPALTGEDIVHMRPDGTVLSGRLAPSSEWPMHAAIYRARPDIRALVHTHSPYATSFAVTHEGIPPVLIEMAAFLGGGVPLAGFAMPGTPEVGLRALEALENAHACLLAGHGALAAGEALPQAHLRAVYMEDAAKIYALAKSHGRPHPLPEDAVRAMTGR